MRPVDSIFRVALNTQTGVHAVLWKSLHTEISVDNTFALVLAGPHAVTRTVQTARSDLSTLVAALSVPSAILQPLRRLWLSGV